MTITLNPSRPDQVRTVTDVELVEEAFRALGLHAGDLNPGFIPYWLQQGKTLAQILEIAGWPKSGNGAAA